MITGKHALVTGGGTGVGRAIALALAETGVAAIAADVTDEAAMTALYAEAEKARGPVDIVIANAGMSGSSPAQRTSLGDWQRTMDVNLTGSFLTVKPALAGMTSAKSGRVVFVASTAGLKGYAYVAPYVAAKHGPGFVETDMLEESVRRIVDKTGRTVEQARASLAATNPQGRFIQPQEVAAAVLWLCSEAAGSITGQAISLSGGETW